MLVLTGSGPAGSYVNWSVIHLSVTNLVMIVLMVVVFVLALLVPFPDHGDSGDDAGEDR